jgi:hypothetical protein
MDTAVRADARIWENEILGHHRRKGCDGSLGRVIAIRGR